MRKHNIIRNILISIVCVLAVLVSVFFVYTMNYSKVQTVAQSAIDMPNVKEFSKYITFGSGEEKQGLIFYPGGKVEYTAYAPLMQKLAEKGIFCVIPKMPFNLAVFDVNAADDIIKNFDNVNSWYIGGHSLGGAMASVYAKENIKKLDGLVLLGAYTTKDFTTNKFKILSIYGSNDGVLNMEKYQDAKSLLPTKYKEYVINGGNHAQFGNYGLQKGDGKATISENEQIEITAEQIVQFISEEIYK